GLVLGGGAAWWIHRVLAQSQTVLRVALLGLLFLGHFLAAISTRAVEVYDPPLGLFTNSYVYFRETNRTAALLKSRLDVSEGASLAPGYDVPEEYIVVFVIRETM